MGTDLTAKRGFQDHENEKSLEDVAPRTNSVIPGEVLKHSHDGDEALKAYADLEGVSLEIDEATNKRLLRKCVTNSRFT